ncbi:spore germination protein [Paenibacillus sp. WQ 127069]|uniref:Spore germination protein n=1 Tax=Paenibacillus baimaensis TaxID=2982185 RepID=A0ABT2UUE7_9BACL|nr:spore germination protein [Paenibacillus sp. WQ 127069]MCU6797721.1 spore germination protein [Paenibacillus sp. WQ 127069]
MKLIDKDKISSMQMAIFMYPAILATSVLGVPSITMKFAGHDMWLSPIWASTMGLVAIMIAFRLNHGFSGQSMIECSTKILGNIGGKLFGLLYMFYLPHLSGIILREYGEFVLSTVLHHTPLFVVMGSLLLLCAVNVRSGIQVIARSSQILIVLTVLLLSFILILLIPEMNPSEILPFAEKGLKPSLLGAIAPAGWFAEYILISFFLPNVSDRSKALKASLLSVVFVTLTMVAINLSCLMLFGDLTDTFLYPVMIAARYINYADFLQHLEAFIVAIWVTGIFVKVSLFLYVHALATAQWLNMDDYRPLVFPLAFLTLVYAFWVVSDQAEVSALLGAGGNIYTICMLVFLPGLLWAVAGLKKLLVPVQGG